MSKKYLGKDLILNSRYKDYFQSLDEKVKEKIIERINELVVENKEYCDKGNYNHLSNIFSALALYQVLQEYTSKEDAFKIVSEEMWKTMESTKAKLQKLLKVPGIFYLIGKFLPNMFKIGSGYGWKYTFHPETQSRHYLQFESNECIYKKIFSKYEVPELGPMFCHADDINFGELEGIKFTRNHTLCRDGIDCDFKFERE